MSGFKGEIESEDCREELKRHLKKKCRVHSESGAIIISDEKGDRELAEDTWRTAGTGQKVANHFGGEMRDCMIEKIDSKRGKKSTGEETMISFGEFLTEVLTLQQRQKRRVAFRRSRMKRKISAEKGRKKLADRQKLDVRSQKKARNTVIGRLFPALKGKPRSDWSIADIKRAEKIVKDKQPIIKRFAKKMFKDVRKAEVERLAKYRKGKVEKK